MRTKHPNALKHGAFAKTAILPGESRQEFEDLHSDLIEEWMPVGRTEEDAVLSIASGLWRKRRLRRFMEAEIVKAKEDPNNIAFDEVTGLRDLAALIQDSPDDAFEKYAPYSISKQNIEYLQKKFPRNKLKSTPEWVQAVIKEIILVLIPQIQGRHRELGLRVLLLQSAAALEPDLFENELAMEERIDAMIDRATKRLIQTKAMKQMLGHNSPCRRSNQPEAVTREGQGKLANVHNKERTSG